MDNNEKMQKLYSLTDSIREETAKAIVGKDREIALLLCSMLCGGHVLIEDVPGVGKTALAQAISKACGLTFRRVQFTPDVMASDITGFSVYNRKTESFEFREGAVMTNLLLADEINRAAPRTQSALLEAMEEKQVTVDGVTSSLPDPFLVIATQNPLGFVGTYPLPEAQLDRFIMVLKPGYPSYADEVSIIRGRKNGNPLDSVRTVASPELIRLLISVTGSVNVSEEIEKYIVSLVTATRSRPEFTLGASPRASIMLMKLSMAHAVLCHRDYVTPDDVADVFCEALSHRVKLSREAQSSGKTASSVLSEVRRSVKVPFSIANLGS